MFQNTDKYVIQFKLKKILHNVIVCFFETALL